MPAAITQHLSKWPGDIVALIAGSGITLALAPFNLWPLGIVALTLLLAVLQPSTAKRSAIRGLLFGIGAFGTGSSWVYVSIHVHGYAPVPLALLLTALFVLVLSCLPMVASYCYSKFIKQQPLAILLGFPALWLLNDWIRGWLFTGFPWLYVGDGHVTTWLAGWAPIVGSSGITFICALSAASIYQAVAKRQFSLLVIAPLFFISGFGLQHISWTTAQANPATIAMVQPNIPQEIKWQAGAYQNITRTLEMMTSTINDADIVLWPEAAVPRLYQQSTRFINRTSQQAEQQNYTLITGIPWRNTEGEYTRYHNSLIALNGATQTYHKQNLVPFGEHLPFESLLRGLIEFFNLPMSSFSPGASDQALFQVNDWRIAPSICYEIAYANLIASNAANSDFLVTVSNDSWFGASIGPLQHLQIAQMRALENSRYLVRGTNNGISAIIDEKGRVVTQGGQFSRETIYGQAIAMQGSTPFSHSGNWPIIIAALLILAGIIFNRQKSA